MRTNPTAEKIERMIAAYFEACKMQDAKAISECFALGAVHYPPHPIKTLRDMNSSALTMQPALVRGPAISEPRITRRITGSRPNCGRW